MRKTRSASGAGGIRQRSDGRWESRYSVVVDGVMERRSIFGATSTEVRQKLRAALTNRDNGLVTKVSARETVSSYFAQWIDGVESTIRPRTAASYRSTIRTYIDPGLGRVPLLKLQPQHIARMYADMASRVSAKTIRNTHGVVHRGLEQAVRWRLVSVNVADLVDPPRRERSEMQALDSVEAARVLEAGRADDDLNALWWLALTVGMRMGELIALRWDSVDLEAGTLRVVASMIRVSGQEARLAEPKTNRSRRQITLSRGALEALRQHRQHQAATSLAAGQPVARSSFVFRRGAADPRPLSVTTLWKRWHRLLKRAGVRAVRFHDARHTAASLLLGRGVHPKVVSEMLGHATVAMTLDVYSHVTPAMSRQAADTMDDLFSSGSG
jgi:integrase